MIQTSIKGQSGDKILGDSTGIQVGLPLRHVSIDNRFADNSGLLVE
jgi:hypothetical protein